VVDPGPHAAIALDPVNARLAYGLAGRRAVVVQSLDALGSADTLDLGDPPGDVVDFGYYVDSADAARVVFSPAGDVLVAQTDEMTVAVWDLSTRTLRKLMDDVEFRAEALVVSGDGSTVAGVSSSVVKFWRMDQGKPIAKFRWLNWTTAVALSPDGSIFAYDYGRELGVVDVARAGLLGIVAVPEGSSGVLAFSADGRAVLSAGNGGSVTRLATHPDEWIARACAIANGVRAIVRWGDDAPAGATPPQRCSAWAQVPVRQQPATP
jgi:WD40 repeat protein